MDDLRSLLLVLAAIYASDCVLWVPRGAVAIYTWWGRRWWLWHPGTLLANARGALFFANPLPPLETVFITQPPPLSLSGRALCSFTAACVNPSWRPPQRHRCLAWEDVREVEAEGKTLYVNKEPFLHAASASLAQRLGRFIEELRSLAKPVRETERERRITQWLAGCFDVEAVRERLETLRTSGKILRVLCRVLFVFLWVLTPWLLWRFGLVHGGAVALGGLLLQAWIIAILFRRQHAKLMPEATEARFVQCLTMGVAPPAAIRAYDYLGRRALETFHPLAVAIALCPRAATETLARHTLRDLSHPMRPLPGGDSAEAQSTEAWFRDAVRQAAHDALAKAGFNPSELLQPPAPSEAVNQAYCPRCTAQFVTTATQCTDCGGLVPLPLGEGVNLAQRREGAKAFEGES